MLLWVFLQPLPGGWRFCSSKNSKSSIRSSSSSSQDPKWFRTSWKERESDNERKHRGVTEITTCRSHEARCWLKKSETDFVTCNSTSQQNTLRVFELFNFSFYLLPLVIPAFTPNNILVFNWADIHMNQRGENKKQVSSIRIKVLVFTHSKTTKSHLFWLS